MNIEWAKGVPENVLIQKRFYSFPPEVNKLDKNIDGRVINGDACNLPVRLVREMPMDSAAFFTSVVEGENYRMQIAKAESIPFLESIKIVPTENPLFRMEANIIRNFDYFRKNLLTNNTLQSYLEQNPGNIMRYDLATISGKEEFPPLKAEKFIPWALEAFSDRKISYILSDYEPHCEGHASIYRSLQKKGNENEAAAATWEHQQFTRNGFEMIKAVDVADCINGKKSAYGYPDTVISVLYKRKQKIVI